MARPRKNNADWFSHDTGLRDNLKVKAVRAKYGLEGYAVFVMILEVLADAENFHIEENEFQIEMLAGDFRIEPEKLNEYILYFANIGLLQIEEGRIFNKHLIERMDPLLSKRENMRQKHQEKKKPIPDEGTSEGSEEPPKPPKAEKPKKELMTEEDFETFWKLYPKKVEKSKASDKFRKLERSLLPSILEGLEVQKKTTSWTKNGGQFVPNPTTWINGQRWNDDPSSLDFNAQPNGQNVGYTGKTPTKQGRVSTDGHADLVV